MTSIRCAICANRTIRDSVDSGLDKGLTGAQIGRDFEAIGAYVSVDVINRHRKHYRDDRPLAPKGTRKTDLAILVRDKVMEKVDSADGDELEAILFSKSGQGAIAVGLKAQSILDGREKEKAKTGRNVELLGALLAIVGIGPAAPVPALEDPSIIEGEAVEVDGAAV